MNLKKKMPGWLIFVLGMAAGLLVFALLTPSRAPLPPRETESTMDSAEAEPSETAIETEEVTLPEEPAPETAPEEPAEVPSEEPSEEPTEDTVEETAYVPVVQKDRPEGGDMIPVIISFGDQDSAPMTVVPDNGTFGHSTALRDALTAYENTAYFYVVIDLYRDGECVSSDYHTICEERDRLSAMGYLPSMEKINGHSQLVFCAATFAELSFFDPSDDLGYIFRLYNEV